MKNPLLLSALALASLGGGSVFFAHGPAGCSSMKKMRKCLLPDCLATTTHNGGYCSAAHCKEHREMRRKAEAK